MATSGPNNLLLRLDYLKGDSLVNSNLRIFGELRQVMRRWRRVLILCVLVVRTGLHPSSLSKAPYSPTHHTQQARVIPTAQRY